MTQKKPSTIIARNSEQKILESLTNSNKPEFLALYGRRRIGKTFLIREFFKEKPIVFFNITGIKDGALEEQINHFTKEIGQTFYDDTPIKEGSNWNDTFDTLTRALDNVKSNKKIVLFFDEFPWMATPKSKLLQSLDYYWNHHWSKDSRIKLIICGSSASWILNNIINNKGGLHNRITKQLLLEPLSLLETKDFLHSYGIKLNNNQVLQLYMAIGGVPYYLTHVKEGLSAIQNIEQLVFSKDGALIKEFDNLFAALFDNHEVSIQMIRTIAEHKYGMGQAELFKKLGSHTKGKLGLSKLKELEDAGFIMSFKPYQNKQKGIYYKAIDEYTLFYLKWIEPIKDTLLKGRVLEGYWESQQNSPAWHSWAGLAFEAICYKHIRQISKAFSLTATAIPYTWRHIAKRGSHEVGAQIDLLFDRNDHAITLCEIKHTDKPFIIDKSYVQILQNKVEAFKTRTKTNKQIFISMISANGVKDNAYKRELIDDVVTLDGLFVE